MSLVTPPSPETVTRWFARAGLVAVGSLAIIAVVALATAYLTLRPALEAQDRTALIARQSLRAQSMATYVHQLMNPRAIEDVYRLHNELTRSLRDFGQGHQALMRGSERLGIAPPEDAELLEMLTREETGLDSLVRGVIRLVEEHFLDSVSKANPNHAAQLLYAVDRQINPLLENLLTQQTEFARGQIIRLGLMLAGAGIALALGGVALWSGLITALGRRIAKAVAPNNDPHLRKLTETRTPDSHILNRNGFLAQLTEETAQAGAQSGQGLVAVLELDGLDKILPDTIESPRRDYEMHALHHQIHRQLRQMLSPGDTVALLSATRFAVLSGSFERPDAIDPLLRGLLNQFTGPLRYDTHSADITPKIGFSLFDIRKSIPSRILSEAEDALKTARKYKIGALVGFHHGLANLGNPTKDLPALLRDALNDGHCEMRYQAYLGADQRPSGFVDTVPGLDHPRLGQFLPGQLEEAIFAAGLHAEYCEWAIGLIGTAIHAWDGAQAGIRRVTLRLSEAALEDLSFLERLRWSTDAANIKPQRIGIAVPSSGIAPNTLAARGLETLNSAGFEILVHRHGTAEMDLSPHGSTRPAALLLGRDAVANLDNSARARSTLAHIMRHAQKMHMPILASGVTTEAEMRALSTRGITAMSGAALTPPRAVAGFIAPNSTARSA